MNLAVLALTLMIPRVLPAQCEGRAEEASTVGSVPVLTVSASIPPQTPSPFDPRIERAVTRFNEGKRLLTEGKKDEARAEFDEAIDILLRARDGQPGRERVEKRLEELMERIYRHDVESLDAGEIEKTVFDKSPLDEIREMNFPVDPTLRTKVLDETKATQSQLPLVVNDSVLSFINYFNSERGRRTLIAGLKRAGRYKPMISKILAEEGVPQELIFLAQAESGFLPRAVSYMAAVGMWQFVQFRGREYGLMQSSYHDDRLDPEKATRAAAKHLKDLYTQFGDWHLAVAAYNCGPGCVDSAVRRTGYADYWELRARNALPRETTNYVPIIIAMTIMSKNAKDYGLTDVVPDDPEEYEVVPVSANTSLQLVADATLTPVTDLKELNPSFTQGIAPAGFDVKVPKGTSQDLAAALDRVPADKRTLWRLHRVQTGETVDSIVRSYRTSSAQIRQTNELERSELEPGSVLVVPVTPEPPKPTYRYAWVRGRRVLVPYYARAVAAPSAARPVVSKAPASKTVTWKAPVKPAAKPTAPRPVASVVNKPATGALFAKRNTR